MEVEYLEETNLLQVIVTDDGNGFPSEKLSHIIEFMSKSSRIKPSLP